MLRKLVIGSLALSMAACAHQMQKTDASRTSPAEGPRQQSERERALTAQLDSKDVRSYADYICGLPQPERWEKAKALLATNNLVAACAFDKDHPLPEDSNRGPIAIIPPHQP